MIPCKKCLLRDIDPQGAAAAIAEYIASYPADKRVNEEEYRRRLGFCLECEELRNATCQKCGCYVELRALKPAQSCPHEEPRW